jgi:hypothetical protein
VGSGGVGAGMARGVRKGSKGATGARHMAGKGGGASAEKHRRRLEVDEGGSICNFPKVQGLLYKAYITIKP